MKKFLIALLTLMPLLASAQDNTWERIEVEEQPKDNPDAKYLEPNAVPEVDGQVMWQTTLYAEGKTADEIYDILLKHNLGAIFHEWLVFKNVMFSLDRTQMTFQIHVTTTDGKADVIINHISYDYDVERKPLHYTAEEWITDKYAVNKKHTKLYPVSAKFRRKTIDRKFNTLINQ